MASGDTCWHTLEKSISVAQWLFLQTCLSPKGTHSDPFRRETFQVWSVRLFLLSVWSSESTQAHSHWRTTLHLQSMQLLQQRFWQPSEARGKEAQRAGNCLKKRPVCLFWHYNAGIVFCSSLKENKDWFEISARSTLHFSPNFKIVLDRSQALF